MLFCLHKRELVAVRPFGDLLWRCRKCGKMTETFSGSTYPRHRKAEHYHWLRDSSIVRWYIDGPKEALWNPKTN